MKRDVVLLHQVVNSIGTRRGDRDGFWRQQQGRCEPVAKGFLVRPWWTLTDGLPPGAAVIEERVGDLVRDAKAYSAPHNRFPFLPRQRPSPPSVRPGINENLERIRLNRDQHRFCAANVAAKFLGDRDFESAPVENEAQLLTIELDCSVNPDRLPDRRGCTLRRVVDELVGQRQRRPGDDCMTEWTAGTAHQRRNTRSPAAVRAPPAWLKRWKSGRIRAMSLQSAVAEKVSRRCGFFAARASAVALLAAKRVAAVWPTGGSTG